MERTINTKKFIESASMIHENKYDYSSVVYKNNKTKVTIICPIHGVFEQIPYHHNNGSGCPSCAGNVRKTNTEFISAAKKIHGEKYDYSLVNYKSGNYKVKIICPIHDEFEQIPSHHLNGHGCSKCSNDVKSKEYFISKSKSIHGNYYDYSLVEFINTKKIVKIICPKHGIFEQRPSHHYNGSGCPICRESKGERDIRLFLTNKNIFFIQQYRFPDCKDKRSLPFDFYLPSINTCIEFDGEQHFKIKNQWGGEDGLLDRQKKDKVKNEYCIKNNIKLIRLNNTKNLNTIL